MDLQNTFIEIRDAVSELGGWPVTMSDWREPPSMEKVLGEVRKLVNSGFLIDAWVGPDDRNSDQYILQVKHTKYLIFKY